MCLPSILSPFLGGVGLVVIWEGLMKIMVLSRPYKLLLKASLGAGTYLRTFWWLHTCAWPAWPSERISLREGKREASKCAPASLPPPLETLGGSPAHAQEPLSRRAEAPPGDQDTSLGLGSEVAAMDQPVISITTTVREDVGHGGSVVMASVPPSSPGALNYRSPRQAPPPKIPPFSNPEPLCPSGSLFLPFSLCPHHL